MSIDLKQMCNLHFKCLSYDLIIYLVLKSFWDVGSPVNKFFFLILIYIPDIIILITYMKITKNLVSSSYYRKVQKKSQFTDFLRYFRKSQKN
jgi:hypothetical protein